MLYGIYRTKVVSFSMVTVLVLILGVACGQGEPAEEGEDESQTLLLGHNKEPGNPNTIAADRFAEVVAENTDNRIEVQVQGGAQLGSDTETLEAMQAGTLDMSVNSQGPLATLVPEVALFGLPFLFSSEEEAYEVVDGDVGDEIASLAEEQGLLVLAWWDNGIRHVTNNTRPVSEPEDLQGLSIRTPDDPMTIDIFEALGASPTPIEFEELYLALQQGTVDGQENPYANIASSDLQEVQEYLSVTGHKYETAPFVVSQANWEELSSEDQEAIREAAEEITEFQREEWLDQTEELETELEAEVQINDDIDQEAFLEATDPVYDQWGEEYGDLVERLQQEAQVE